MKWLDKFVEKCIKPIEPKAKSVDTSFADRYNRLKEIIDRQLGEIYFREKTRYGK